MGKKPSEEKGIDDLRERRKERGELQSIRDSIKDKLKESEAVEDIKFFREGEEHYVFHQGDELRCEITLSRNPDYSVLSFSLDKDHHLSLYSKDKSESKEDRYVFKFSLDSVFLDVGNYEVSIFSEDGSLLEGLKLKIKEGEKRLPDHLVLEDPLTDSKFPEGKFYAFGDVENILEDFEKGRTICIYDMEINEELIEDNFDKGKLITN